MKSSHPKRIQKQGVLLLSIIMILAVMVYALGVANAATSTPTSRPSLTPTPRRTLITPNPTPTSRPSSTPVASPTIPVTAVKITIGTQCSSDAFAYDAYVYIEISPPSLEGINRVNGSYPDLPPKTLSYLPDTEVTLRAVTIQPTRFVEWLSSPNILTGNPVSLIVKGGETIIGKFSGSKPTPTPRRSVTITPTPTSLRVTPTNPRNAIKITVGLLCEGEVSSSTAIINISPASLEGVSQVSGGYTGSYSPQTWALSYLPNTSVTFTATSIDRTQFSGWSSSSIPPLSGNPVSVIVQGGEKIIGEFWAPFPTPRVTPTPTRRVTPTGTATPTPTRRVPATVTPTPTVSGSYVVSYAIQSDWGNGATGSVTIKNNSAAAVNGWTLAWTFPGNQTITNLWNGSYTQSGAAVSVRDAGHNANIPANGGTVNFGFNLIYSGTNAKPTSFTLNGTPCLVQ